MAKESGLGMTLSIDDAAGALKDISNDILQCSWVTPRGVQDVTGLDKSALERLTLLADGTLDVTCAFNDAASMSFAVFSTASSASVVRTVTILVSGNTLTMEMVITSVTWNRASDGSLTMTASLALADGTAPTWA